MEIRLAIEEQTTRVQFEKLLDSLAKLYSLDEDKFAVIYENMPRGIADEFERIIQVGSKFEDTELEDIIDYTREVDYYFESWSIKYAKQLELEHEQKMREPRNFTLRNPDDLRLFEEFLDRMLKLLDLSAGHFVELITQCPIAYWDKIDDLRETSFKRERDSSEYLRCLEKCKRISFAYSDYTNSLSKIEDDEY